jgi:putative DNA primase/helicase
VNWVNYDDVIAQLRTSGLVVDAIEPGDIGTRRRCRTEGDKEKRGWYHLHELSTDSGTTLLVGSFGIWRGADPGTQKIALTSHTLTREQQQALRERIREDQKREQARRRGQGERAARRAGAMWQRLSPAGTCDYLERKHVQGFGVRYSARGAMAIPLLDVHGTVHGLQLIYPRGHEAVKRLERDKDFWPTGLVKQGHFFLIGSPAASRVLLLAEGYATGATLHMATGLPVAIAFDAGNLLHVAKAIAARYTSTKILVCADDDYLIKCRHCGALTGTADANCSHCGGELRAGNAGQLGADAAALAVGGSWVAPWFNTPRPRDSKGPTDFNDLHVLEGLHVVRAQIEARISALQWAAHPATGAVAPPAPPGEGEGDSGAAMYVITSVQQLTERFHLVYEMRETVFDAREHKLVPLGSQRNICATRQLHRQWMESLDKKIARVIEIGFDPTERDTRVRCNLWGGWPTRPQAGNCSKLLELGEYLCSDDARSVELWAWMLKWLAYPIQHPGAKMKTALVLHGPQGTGKNLFFEHYMQIYGEYGKVIDQEAIEDKFNDTFSRKLFVVADEVVARQELYHTKGKLKGLVTGTEIRINPKNVGAYFEVNHLNLVFLSNEPQPMVLERDDRRYCVIWTPPKLEPAVYHEVLAEIAAGGVAALHDYLLNLPLGDFGPATLPPMTQAKADLIELSLDSSERFYNQWLAREVPLPLGPVRTEDLYDGYRHWCKRQGVAKPAPLSTMVGALSKRPGVVKARPRHYLNHSRTMTTQSTVLWPPGVEQHPPMSIELSDQLARFADAVAGWTAPPALPGRNSGQGAPVGPNLADDEEPF